MFKKIGIYGAEKHGKTTLHAALVSHAVNNGGKVHLDLSYPNHDVDDETLRQVLHSGGSIFLGCDHEITEEGRELSKQIRRIEEEIGSKFNMAHRLQQIIPLAPRG